MEHLEALSLHEALASLDSVLEEGQKQEKVPVEILDDLLTREHDARFERRVATNLRLSGIAHPKRLEDFDYDAEVDVTQQLIQELATLRFLHNGENVLFLGPPGVGKSHWPPAWHRRRSNAVTGSTRSHCMIWSTAPVRLVSATVCTWSATR